MSSKNQNKPAYHLAKPVKKGIFHLIFSRFMLFFLLILIQAFLVLIFYAVLEVLIPWLTTIRTLFVLVMVIYLFNSSMDSTAKLTWMLIIAILPVPGTLLLWFTQSNAGYRKLKKQEKELILRTMHIIRQSGETMEKLHRDGSGVDDLSTYLNQSGCFPVYENTEVTYFPSGEAKFEALLEELKKAERFIFLEYFIIEEGWMWGEILQILKRKARSGVDVRVMYDGMCELSQLPGGYWKLLEEERIRAKIFSRIIPVASSHYNYRDHRKILVIDGKTAFTGGVNLADEYINLKERFGHWKDTAVMLKGPAVKSFTLMFLQMWCIGEYEPVIMPYLRTEPLLPKPENGYVMPYGDCPLDGFKVGETVYMDILNRANHYVHIMTPYLILDGELETALKYAAYRGIDVKIILPGIPDKKMAYALAKSYYRTLISSGIRIYEYTPGFVHAKVFVSDDVKAVTGTINLDYRSLYHHFECAAFLYKTSCIPEIEADFQDTLLKCREVTPYTIQKEKLFYKLAGPVLRFFAPLM